MIRPPAEWRGMILQRCHCGIARAFNTLQEEMALGFQDLTSTGG
ncbi:hypothetical protein SAMN05445060_2377 [Williamsia sterculiae]|uniref:Uncharacterized protein n=1 Tax=Williamsia sterculiae TaxID=1344003 RepID=A0A1N7FXF4_9NOCA|nr:hypothetical protein SAMN05445060_2377 [Williamsia sterculiae]